MNEIETVQSWRVQQRGNINQKPSEDSGLTVEDVDYEPMPISSYELENGHPLLIEKLGIKDDFRIDEKIRVMAAGIDRFIRTQTERDSQTSYEMVFGRITSRLPESLERMVRGNNGIKVLQLLFQEVSVHNELSSESYLELLREELKREGVEKLKKQLLSLTK